MLSNMEKLKVVDGMIWDSEIDKWIPEEDYKDKLTVFDAMDAPDTGGSYKVGSIYGVNYSQLYNFLGEPTFDEPSGDDKTQVEWVVEFNDEVFTIYDWKTYDRHYTKNSLTTWSIGGKSSGFELSDYIESQIKALELPF